MPNITPTALPIKINQMHNNPETRLKNRIKATPPIRHPHNDIIGILNKIKIRQEIKKTDQ